MLQRQRQGTHSHYCHICRTNDQHYLPGVQPPAVPLQGLLQGAVPSFAAATHARHTIQLLLPMLHYGLTLCARAAAACCWVFVVELVPQHLTPHGLVTGGLHNCSRAQHSTAKACMGQ